MLTFRELEQIAETILEHATPEETQSFLEMDSENRFLWTKHKIASLEAQA